MSSRSDDSRRRTRMLLVLMPARLILLILATFVVGEVAAPEPEPEPLLTDPVLTKGAPCQLQNGCFSS